MAMPASQAKHATPSTLENGLILANGPGLSKGELPPSTCHQQSATMVTGQEHIVWTQDEGRLLAWTVGGPHDAVIAWWSDVHHDIYLGGMHM
jgi:hypothetical protein